MAIIENKVDKLKKAINKGYIKEVEQTPRIQKLLKNGIIRDNCFMFFIAISIAIVSFLLFIIFCNNREFYEMIYETEYFVQKARTPIFAILFVGMTLPSVLAIVVLVGLIKNIKLIKSKNYKCYVGKVSKINNEQYSVANIEDIQVLPGAKPSKNIQVDDKIIIAYIGEELYVLDYEFSLKEE